MKTIHIILAAAMIFLLAAAPGCSLLKKRVEKTENVKYEFTSTGKTTFKIDNSNGNINISNSSDSSGNIKIDAEITAKVKADEMDKPIDNVKINIDSSGSEVKVETEIIKSNSGFFRRHSSPEVNYNIKLPANMKVISESVNGTITISRINGDINAENVNGRINVLNCRGKLDLESVNGTIICNVDSVTSGINISLTNGDVKLGGLKNVNAEINSQTTNGKVTYKNLTFTNASNERTSLSGILGNGGAQIKIETINGRIILDGSKVIPKKDNSLEFKIDFDDEDEPIQINDPDEDFDKNDDNSKVPDAKTFEPNKDSMKSVVPKTTEPKTTEPKNADSTKK
ncbi:MAG: hypothetical protein IT280_11525 [Ignavibacteria bacterium]|nr:hypothetical protein [Ignavibacteria bacterium]